MFSRHKFASFTQQLLAMLLALTLFSACGVKGPPLPPLDEPETPNKATKDSMSNRSPTPTPKPGR